MIVSVCPTMSALSSLLKLFTARQILWKPYVSLSCFSGHRRRSYSDKQDVTSNHIAVSSQGSENEERVRVRRARPADVPRVLRFVREHAKAAGLVAPPSASHLVLCDYVARALAQGHSMLAEQQEARRGWSNIRGLALGLSVCPWDASLLERWARCVKCTRSRRLMHFTAHCLRAPALHDKYRVHNILQVIMILPHGYPKSTEVVHVLAKNAIQRGRDVGFPVLRFDVTDNTVGNALEQMQLKKEWQLMYNVLPQAQDQHLTEPSVITSSQTTENDSGNVSVAGNFIAVYTAMTGQEPKKVNEDETNIKSNM